MNNKKSLLQDSLQELENIKNESLELAKEQLINESADLLEKKSAALFEKIIADEGVEEGGAEEEESTEESKQIDEILNELKKASEEDMDDEDEMSDNEMSDNEMSDDEMSDDEIDSEEEDEMSLDALRKAAEEHGFKLVADTDDEEEMDSDDEEMDSDKEDEEEMDDSDDEEDIEFGDEESDEDEFSDVNVDDRVLAEPSDDEDGEEDESFQKINENFKRNNTKMRNTKKQVLKDLRDVSFNKLVEAYYNMGDNDSFIIKENQYMDENEYMEEDLYDEGIHMMDINPTDEDYSYDENYNFMEEEMPIPSRMPSMPSRMSSKMSSMPSSRHSEEEMIYEIDMPDENYGHSMMDEMDDAAINEMLDEMDVNYEGDSREHDERMMHNVERTSRMPMPQGNELEEMFNEMTMEELMEMNEMLQEEGDMFIPSADEDYMKEGELSEEEIAEMYDQLEEGEEPLDELFSGLRGAFGQAAAGIAKLGSTAKQAVGKYATEIGQAYQDAELANEVKKLETLANNIGKQILALDSRRERAGKPKLEPKDIVSLITTLSNQMRTGAGKAGYTGNVSLANTKIGQTLQGKPQMMEEDDDQMEEGIGYVSQTHAAVGAGPKSNAHREGAPDRRSLAEEEVVNLQEQLKKLKQENKSLNEGFTNKVKSLENKVYDVTISALKAGFVNKFLLEHPLRENEKLQIIHRFSNAQTKEQIKETYISLTNEFAKGQTVKDGSMLNESVQNKVGKIHKTDNALVKEKDLINENDESIRFKQLLNYNFNKKK
jgi:hypothetical protein